MQSTEARKTQFGICLQGADQLIEETGMHRCNYNRVRSSSDLREAQNFEKKKDPTQMEGSGIMRGYSTQAEAQEASPSWGKEEDD